MKRYSAAGLTFLTICVFIISAAYAGIATTKHNLTVSGPGTVKSEFETRICVFCHTPHHGVADIAGIGIPLWNHTLSAASYQLYWSSTLLTYNPSNQPDGSSRLCLSCHDGTVAIGSVIIGESYSISGSPSGLMPAGPSNMGTDLSASHHPVSMEINGTLSSDKAEQCRNNEVTFTICRPPSGSPVRLEKTNNHYPGGGSSPVLGVQCSSCHDPHEDPIPGTTVFLRAGTKGDSGQLCEACHIYNDCDAVCP